MAKILVAASPKPGEVIERVLTGPDHELVCVHTMSKAEQSLRKNSFDLIICTIVFDDSRMFEFLRLAKSRPAWRPIPFICVRAREEVLRVPLALEAVRFTAMALGAVAFLDVTDYRENPDRDMKTAVERFLRS